MAEIRHDDGCDDGPFEPPPRPASTSILPDGRSVTVHPMPTKRRSKPESLAKAATINSARDRLSQRHGADNLRELYEESPPHLYREDATVGQEPVDYKERAISVYNQFPAAPNGEGDQSLIGSICNFFPVVPTSNFSSEGSSGASVAPFASSSRASRNDDLVKHSSALLDKDLPREPFLQDQIPFKDLFPNPPAHSPQHSAKSSLSTNGALSFVTAYDGAFGGSLDAATHPTGELANSNIASSTALFGPAGTQLSPISDHTEPSSARGSPTHLVLPNQRRRRIGATVGGSPRGRTIRPIGSVIGDRPSAFYLTPQPEAPRQHIAEQVREPITEQPREHIADEMKVPLCQDLCTQAITYEPPMTDGCSDPFPVVPQTAARRYAKYKVGPTYRESHDAHELIMGYKRGEKPPEETSDEGEKGGIKTKKKDSKHGRKSVSNSAANLRASLLDDNSVVNRLSRPTATSAAREAINKDRRRNVFDDMRAPPEPKVVKENRVKRAGHSMKTKLSSFMGSRGKNVRQPDHQSDAPLARKKSVALFDAAQVVHDDSDHRISRNITTYQNSGMNRRVSQLPRPYATTPDLTEFTAVVEPEDSAPRPSTSHDEHLPSLHHTRAISAEHTFREEAHASREELGDVFRSQNASLMDLNGRFRDHSNAVSGPSSAASRFMSINDCLRNRINGLDTAVAGPSSAPNGHSLANTSAANGSLLASVLAANGSLSTGTSTSNNPAFASPAVPNASPASNPTPPSTQGGGPGGPAMSGDMVGDLVDDMLRQAENSINEMVAIAGRIQDPAARDRMIEMIMLLSQAIITTRSLRIELFRTGEDCVSLASKVQMLAAEVQAKLA